MICTLCGAKVPSSQTKQILLQVYVDIDHKSVKLNNMYIGIMYITLCRECLRQRPDRIEGKLIFE